MFFRNYCDRTSTLSEDEKTALLPCFVAEVMSSDNEVEVEKFFTKPLPWKV